MRPPRRALHTASSHVALKPAASIASSAPTPLVSWSTCPVLVHVHAHAHAHGHGHRHGHCAGTYIWARLGAHVRRALRRVDSRRGAQLDGLVSRGAARVHRDDARLWHHDGSSPGRYTEIKIWHPLALALAVALALPLGRKQPAPAKRGGELWPPTAVRVLVRGAVRLGHHDAREAEPAAAKDGDALALPEPALRARRLGLG